MLICCAMREFRCILSSQILHTGRFATCCTHTSLARITGCYPTKRCYPVLLVGSQVNQYLTNNLVNRYGWLCSHNTSPPSHFPGVLTFQWVLVQQVQEDQFKAKQCLQSAFLPSPLPWSHWTKFVYFLPDWKETETMFMCIFNTSLSFFLTFFLIQTSSSLGSLYHWWNRKIKGFCHLTSGRAECKWKMFSPGTLVLKLSGIFI